MFDWVFGSEMILLRMTAVKDAFNDLMRDVIAGRLDFKKGYEHVKNIIDPSSEKMWKKLKQNIEKMHETVDEMNISGVSKIELEQYGNFCIRSMLEEVKWE